MPIPNDLFLAILAMDAYNRGYNSGIGSGNVGLGGVGSQIGNATVVSADGGAVAQAASFYAQSYTWNGKTVVSYRGTDSISGDLPAFQMGAGNYNTSQGELAVDFYRNAVGGIAAPNGNVIVTGHSLGGGLAGYVGSLYRLEGLIFDNMAFELELR